MDVNNDEIHKHAKSQCETFCIVDYIKMTKYDRLYSFEMYSHTFVIFVYPKVLRILH
jgi:hypothetical protein